MKPPVGGSKETVFLVDSVYAYVFLGSVALKTLYHLDLRKQNQYLPRCYTEMMHKQQYLQGMLNLVILHYCMQD